MALVGTGEITKKHGLTRIQVFRLMAADDWPEPVQELKRGRLWDEEAVDERVRLLRKAGRLTKTNTIVPWRYLDRGEKQVELRPWAEGAKLLESATT